MAFVTPGTDSVDKNKHVLIFESISLVQLLKGLVLSNPS